MNESNEIWGSPWRTLQQLLANQPGAVFDDELCPPESDDDGAADASCWIKRARRRQQQTLAFRQ